MTKPAKRFVAVLTSMAIAGAGLMALSHQVAERHQVCAEHGELIHVSANGELIVTDSSTSVWQSSPDDEHGDHCAVSWMAPQSPDPQQPPTASAIAETSNAEPTASVRIVAGSSLFRLAPKTSPPA